MFNKINNILYISTGGGIGDALNSLSTINLINREINPNKIYYYSTDLEKFWFENKLQEFKPKNLEIIKNFPQHFGTKINQITISKKLINNFGLEYFDMIVDNQTVINNTLIYKRIPHKYYISPSCNYFFSKPFFFIKKTKNINLRIIQYLNKLLNLKLKPDYDIKIPEIFLNEAKKIIKNDKKYIGFSITMGHPTRNKEFDIKEIVKLSNHYSDRYIPTFFIENKFVELKKFIKENIKNSFFPEDLINQNLRKPMMVTALGSLTNFNISIDNGISHMLAYSKNKNYIFYNKNSEKFKPLEKNSIIFDCENLDKNINQLTFQEILEFIDRN